MKKTKIFLTALVCLALSAVSCDRDKVITADQLPPAAQNYLKKQYPGVDVTFAKIDKERYGYDIELSNDIDLKFNYQGALIGMDD